MLEKNINARLSRLILSLLMLCAFGINAWAQDTAQAQSSHSAQLVRVAVAANFAAPMNALAEQFSRDTGHRVVASVGATGALYAQIKHGAPFDVLLSADEATAIKLVAEGLGVADSRFVFAVGQLVLWSKKNGLVDAKGAVLSADNVRKIAIANPHLSPYGAAAIEVMHALNLQGTLAPKIVEGANIGQAYQFVATENAELGFVALSQVWAEGKIREGSAWRIPSSLYSPIRQAGLLLTRAHNHLAAQAFLQYLKSERAKAIIAEHGYGF